MPIAEAIEAHAAKGFEVIAGGDARIDFDADFGVGREGEALARVTEEIFDLFRREIGGRAAAPVELRDRAIAGDTIERCDRFPFSEFRDKEA